MGAGSDDARLAATGGFDAVPSPFHTHLRIFYDDRRIGDQTPHPSKVTTVPFQSGDGRSPMGRHEAYHRDFTVHS